MRTVITHIIDEIATKLGHEYIPFNLFAGYIRPRLTRVVC